MKALFASKAKSMLRKCAPQTTKDPASTTCRGWQMMKTGSSGGDAALQRCQDWSGR
jgi:hypothetical protein